MSSKPPAPKHVEMVDLFAGPGGLDVGAHWLGVRATGVEFDDNACATRKAAGLRTVQSDVRLCNPEDYFRTSRNDSKVAVLTGGPPCQTYSVAGAGAGRDALEQVLTYAKRMGERDTEVEDDVARLRDERTGLVLEPLKWALTACDADKPFHVIVLEQVPTVLPVWQEFARILIGMGYTAKADILHTEEFGVPQTRRRAILIAKLGGEFIWPEPTHRKFGKEPSGKISEKKLKNWVSMAEALQRRDEFEVVSNYGTGGDPKARGRRRFDEPAFTVTGKVSRNKIVDLSDRYIGHLQIEDAGRLQTFPRDYPWSGNDIAQQIGNAIPPRLAAHVLSAAIFGMQPDAKQLDKAVKGTWRRAIKGSYRLLPELENSTDGDEPLTLFKDTELLSA